jgi:hypothetical protein
LPYEKNPLELGQLWAKTGQKGDYLTGEVNGIKVVCFPVNSENPKAPTWRVLRSVPREDKPKGKDIGGGFQVEGDDIGF